jgi:hypothetical protein
MKEINEEGREGLRMQRTEEVYQRKKMSLEYCMEEGGTRGEILGLRKESCAVSQRGENLAQ